MPKKIKTPAEKAAETRAKKQALALKQLGEETPKKKRKRRKPMSDEQKAAASERLKKARAARKPAKNLSVHETIRDLDEDHPLNPKEVKRWIKEQKKALSSMRHFKESSHWKERMEYQTRERRVYNMEAYLRSGVWLDPNWGEFSENKMVDVCIAMAYYPDGTPKRTKGTWYPDMREVYTGEEESE